MSGLRHPGLLVRSTLFISTLATISGCGSNQNQSKLASEYAGSSFADVWQLLKSDAYTDGTMPQYQTKKSNFFENGVNILARSAGRTLSDPRDILPRFQKLVHPVGVCLAGTWTITEQNPYSGYFAKGSQGQIIIRASEAMGNPEVGSWRGFGLAGKIFPTTDAQDKRLYKTANFFTVDDLGGTDAASIFDLPKSNKPAASFHAGSILLLPTIHAIVNAFNAADTNASVRQVYQISQLGLADPAKAVTPPDFILKSETTARTGDADFRDEMRVSKYATTGGIKFGIYAGDATVAEPQRIGQIVLTDDVTSDSCDHRLHFQHPKFKNP